MKLDSEPTFCHSTPVHKVDSKPFEYNGNALDSAGPNNEIVKDNQNGILCDQKEGYEKDADSLPSEMSNGDGLWKAQELDCSLDGYVFTNGNENEIRDSVEPYTISSREMELFEKDTDFYTNKSVMECELPELIVCYKENTYHVVKDICIDEGVPSQDKILVEIGMGEVKDLCTFLPLDGDKSSDFTKENVDFELPIPDGLKSSVENDCNKDTSNHCCSEDSMRTDEANYDATDKITNDISKKKIMPENMLLVQELGIENNSLPESCNFGGNEVKQQSVQIPLEEENLASLALVSAAGESSNSSPVNKLSYNSKVETGSITFNFDSSTSRASGREESLQNGDSGQPLETQNMSRLEDGMSDNVTVSSRFQYSHGESSFSVMGPLSGLISYSGPIAYSGSVSLRSDSSTTSTRSFAFPVLQNEWNSSPVRMAKADRRHFRKHRGWRQGLLCCRF